MLSRLPPREERGRAAVWVVVGVCLVVVLVVLFQPRGGGGDLNAEVACGHAAGLSQLLNLDPGESLTEDGERAVYDLMDELRETVEEGIDDPEVASAAQDVLQGPVEIPAIKERAWGLWRACDEFESQQQSEEQS